MEKMDKSLISIFNMDVDKPELLQTMRDMAALAGVLNDLSDKESFHAPRNVLRFIRILNLINQEALGMTDPIENEDTLFYRYRHTYGYDEEMTIEYVKHLTYVLGKFNWITKTAKRIKMRDLGKRMMDVLIRLANDSLAYYMNDDVARSLFQAKRDAEISEAYDDKGISGGNKLASMIKNVEEAILLLTERELEYLADRNALSQVEVIHQLMKELETKMVERLAKFETFDQELVFASIKQRGMTAISEGTKISLGTINKILKFAHLQETDFIETIQPDLLRNFIVQSFDPPIGSEIPNAHQILSFMEQGQYEGEELDGLWAPVKFASPLSPNAIDEGIDYIENYEPVTDAIEEEVEEDFQEIDEIMEDQLEEIMGDSKWQMTKQMIHTEHIEKYLDEVEEAGLDELVIQAGSDKWSDVLNGLIGVSALVANKKADIDEKANRKIKGHMEERDWRWADDKQGSYAIRKRRK
ncbi:hypothetical protein AN964_18275 [Heyndrickxia shackletonii]|uniref:Uncharacterized protein n=1 Tax=Heyndrickxia shackletonii TaxID=157838 RepID=A0A0Q3TMP0_9BACI|nr:hypothetical protein AN964_18275 [Heyndrickxia shackletonii]MBB2483006.1 hypothetical protein [Bacillus sp. APMAM]NEY98793.1 hypothetical protein [Heyndrickxia shackletonii]RTZ53551.1 hypothetical protein EKO25_22710 [Bacillus sp. SAJ1]